MSLGGWIGWDTELKIFASVLVVSVAEEDTAGMENLNPELFMTGCVVADSDPFSDGPKVKGEVGVPKSLEEGPNFRWTKEVRF